MAKLSDYVSDDGVYIIPVEWAMYSNVLVTGVKNLQEAKDLVDENIGDIPLDLDCAEYMDGSYRISHDDDQLIDAQDYQRFGTDYHNPKAED